MTKISEIPVISTEMFMTDKLEKETAAGDSEQFTAQLLYNLILANLPTSALLNQSNTLYVDGVYGDDSTGERENSQKPFATIAAATAVANAGDWLKIFPTPTPYTDTFLGKDQIKYYYLPGCKHSGANLYTDGASDISFGVYGLCEFIGSGTICSLGATFGSVDFNCLSITSTSGFLVTNSAKLNANIIQDIITTNSPCIRMSCVDGNPEIFVKCRNIISNRICIYTDSNTVGAQNNGMMTVYANKIKVLDANIYSCIAPSAGLINIHANVEVDATSFGQFVGGIDNSGAVINIYGDCFMLAPYALSFRDTPIGITNFYGQVYAEGAIVNFNGIANFRSKVITNFAGNTSIRHLNGKTFVYDLVKNLDNTSAGCCVSVEGPGFVSKQTAVYYCTSGAASALTAVSSQIVKTYQGACSNVGVNVNITEQISTILTDSNVDAD